MLKGEAKKEYQRDYMKAKRSNIRSNKYPHIVELLVQPEKRKKLEKISKSLKDFRVDKHVYLGYPRMIPFDIIGEMLEVTQ